MVFVRIEYRVIFVHETDFIVYRPEHASLSIAKTVYKRVDRTDMHYILNVEIPLVDAAVSEYLRV